MSKGQTVNQDKNMTFEQAMARLDEIVTALDSGDMSLDSSMALFLEGSQLVSFCNKSIEGAKLTLEELFPEAMRNIGQD